MHPVLAQPLRADDVCAYLWARADQPARAAACARAQISDAASLLDWYELGKAERIPLVLALVDEITTRASQQRQALRAEDGTIGALADKAASLANDDFPGASYPVIRSARAAAHRVLSKGGTFDEAVVAARDEAEDMLTKGAPA